jgi:hypothetical protein
MKHASRLLTIFFIGFPFLISKAQHQQKETAMDRLTRIVVTENITGSMDVGIGWNDATTLDGRWYDRLFTEEDWDRYFGLMEWSGCHWLRHAMSIKDWEPENDNNDPDEADWQRFTFNSERMQRHYTFLDQAEKRNIKILMTNWGLDADWLMPANNKSNLAHPADDEEFAEAMASLVYHLKEVRNYKNFWALSLWNEPNGKWAYKGPDANYPVSFWPLYSAVDKHLNRLGVREKILLLGPDTSTGGNPGHIPEMLEEYGMVLDIIADHDYSAFRGEKMDRSVAAYDKLQDAITQAVGKKLPFVIGEFGNYGNEPGPVDNDDMVYKGALSTTSYLIRMLNRGVSGLARWEFHIYGQKWRNFGALTRLDPEYVFRPYGPVYYPHAITARYVKPGWKVRQLLMDTTTDDLYATVLTSAEGDITLMLLNDSNQPVSVELQLNIPVKTSVLHHLEVSGPVPEGIIRKTDLDLAKSEATVTLPPLSITTLTSLAPGNLDLPEKLSLKR